MWYTALTCTRLQCSGATFRQKGKFKQNSETRWGEKADEAYSSALSWICGKQETRGEKSWWWGSLRQHAHRVSREKRGGKKGDNACRGCMCVVCVFAHSCWSSTLAVRGLRATPRRWCLLMLPQVKRAKTMRKNKDKREMEKDGWWSRK